jgi:alkylation response protein AidB-like acyl-CoA dehydrogenase
MISKDQILKGGQFLLDSVAATSVFTPEDHTEEQQMLRSAIRRFLDKEIEPNKEIFDSKEGIELAQEKLEILGELGFLGLSVPEKYGGYGCDMKSDLVASEIMSDSFSFSQTLGVQRGLGINTILFYGNEAQKKKYLEGIISGKIKCSYCLTEPSAGSDANSGKSKATYSDDGKYLILNGQKMWITNAGFADVFSVFCKIEDDENLSCLIVEKEWGVKLGAEELKLGIHGSSTRQVFFENVKVPVENLLGERNKGFKIAMNALNMGRLMIGIAGSAISKRAFRLGVSYANERVQFGKSISSFGAIQEKIAAMATNIYALESSWHRLAGDMDAMQLQEIEQGSDILIAKQKVANEFAIECALITVEGSEIEDFVVDEALQMHGGMGFSGESEISVLYKNIRGNRIYEGTNEINRLVIAGTLLKYGFKGKLPLMDKIMVTFNELKSGKILAINDQLENSALAESYINNTKKVVLLTIGMAAQKYQANIKDNQEVLSRLSDLLSYIYFMESVLLRAQKNEKPIHMDLMLLYICEKTHLINQSVKEVVFNCKAAERATRDFEKFSGLLRLPAIDIISLRRKVAKYFIDKNEYKI